MVAAKNTCAARVAGIQRPVFGDDVSTGRSTYWCARSAAGSVVPVERVRWPDRGRGRRGSRRGCCRSPSGSRADCGGASGGTGGAAGCGQSSTGPKYRPCPRPARGRARARPPAVLDRQRAQRGATSRVPSAVEEQRRASRRGARARRGDLLAAHRPGAWNRPRAAGIAISVAILAPPPDWPNTVTLPGSPPNTRRCFAHPVQRGDQVELPGIAGVRELAPVRTRQDRGSRSSRADG